LSDDAKEVQFFFASRYAGFSLLFHSIHLILALIFSEEDYSLFCMFLNTISQFFAASYPNLEFQESAQCTSCDIDNTSLSELFEMIV
jgi:hypothetical protein